MNLDGNYSARSRYLYFILGVALTLFIGFLDYLTGTEINVSVFFLLPVSIVSWYVNGYGGVFMAIASAVTWYTADKLSGEEYTSYLIPVWNALVGFGFLITSAAILLRLKKALRSEHRLSGTDPITEIGNARNYYHHAHQEIEKARRYNHPITVAYIDVDDFKVVNDTFGHNTGDHVLHSVADTIRQNVRSTDIVGRVGGDEFAVLLPETGGTDGLEAIEKVMGLLLAEMDTNEWPVTFSMGVVAFTQPPDSVDELLKEADNLMYQAKKSGKNRIIFKEI